MPRLLPPLVAVVTPLALLGGLLGPAPAASARPVRDTALLAAVSAARSTPHPVSAAGRAGRGNPLAGRPWGTYEGPQELAWAPYESASGHRKKLLGYIALTPKAKWFGAWIPDSQIAQRVRDYITNAQHGDPRTLVQLTVFRMVPWEQDACHRLPSKAERASYKRWVRRFAGAVGGAHAAIVLQPDGPFALCAPHDSAAPSHLVAYAAKELSAQPHTSVYVEAGAADWPAAGQGGVDAAVRILVRGGIGHARGFALNSTHYDATGDEIRRAAAISAALAARGYAGKKAVINTSGNGHPWPFGSYRGKDPDNATVCASRDAPASSTCETLGIPPTTKVAAARWGLSASLARQARRYVDAYLWVGRPWLYRQNQPFVMKRALQLVRSTPWR
jgi:endoglucanase